MQQLPMRNKKPKSVFFTACKAVHSKVLSRQLFALYTQLEEPHHTYNQEHNFCNVFISTSQPLFYFCIGPSDVFQVDHS